jgi:hypothetical protein
MLAFVPAGASTDDLAVGQGFPLELQVLEQETTPLAGVG